MTLHQLLRDGLQNHAYPGYVYGYPHKKAYRPLARPRSFADAWRDEPRVHLFCYVHLPFCTTRCSFCNLFTCVPDADPADRYLDALARQMEHVGRTLGRALFDRLYLGGGTPTYLTTAQLARLARLLRDLLGVDSARTQGCIEASPDTLTSDKIALLHELGFQRLSLGVQSFVPAELHAVNRRFPFDLNRETAEAVARARFPHFNIDLIYGLPGQTPASWRTSLETALALGPTSLFLYPLYVRPLTGLAQRGHGPTSADSLALARLYDIALEVLTAAGFRQHTMRQFLREPLARPTAPSFPEYGCEQDAMLGLGAGARSYTRGLHYSTPWKMRAVNIRAVIADFEQSWTSGDDTIRCGFELDDDERRRRYVILTLLYQGLDLARYRAAFGRDARADYVEAWNALADEDCITETDGKLRLTPRGVRHSDVVGQLFFSPRVRRLLETFEYD